MRVPLLLAACAATALAAPVVSHDKPSVDEAAVQARKLVRAESLADLDTVFQSGDKAGSAIGLLEYYADCDDDGSLTLLMVEVGHTFKNWMEGSPVSFSIRQTRPAFSPASQPRVALSGDLAFIEGDDAIEAAKVCFLHRHPDAHAWLPGNKIHATAFMKFNVESVYWLGGFGNVAFIGDIPTDLYTSATLPRMRFPHPSVPGHGRHNEDDDEDEEEEHEEQEEH
ncbi:pyridoxamine 5'-phosphate oxidase-domain-containing protein, partial [Limtongia smithiae]|uniref:pyridoxamine 5'-phosphate oxidase-domain-containing protein n=1 Tax=Limtongia smithiae TaxID=1125753 RepID=UPI0034CE86E1